MVSYRVADNKQERIVNKFLELFYYNKHYGSVEMVEDKERQTSGIDVIADGMLIDNKAQSGVKYINNPTDTYILELSFLNKYQEETVGWFLDTKSKTTHYLFVWIHDAIVGEDNRIIPYRGINKVEVMLVDKSKLREMIGKVYSDYSLISIARKMRDLERPHQYTYMNGIKFSHTPTLDEKPCNLVLSKDKLLECAVEHCFVTPDEIIHI